MAGWRLLFVCTANIARSPYAEWRSRNALADADVDVASAGIRARDGAPMGEGMDKELARRDVAQEHVSRALRGEQIEWADVIVVFEFRHHMWILDRWPEAGEKIVGFHQLTDGIRALEGAAAGVLGPEGGLAFVRPVLATPSMTLDVDDPYGGGAKAARQCAAEIDEGLVPILTCFSGHPVQLERPAERPRRGMRWLGSVGPDPGSWTRRIPHP